MQLEWDDAKRTRTLEERDIDFADARYADWARAIRRQDLRDDYDEIRIVALVPLRERLHVIVYVLRGSSLRIISMRKANPREVESYVDPTEDTDDR